MSQVIITPGVESVVKQTAKNLYVYMWVKDPVGFTLEPQQQVMFDIIKKAPITRYDLCNKLAKLIQTKSTISLLVAHHERRFVQLGLIMKMTPFEHREYVAREEDKRMYASIKQNPRGGWSIHIPPDNPQGIGNYDSEYSARDTLRRNCMDEENGKDIDNEANVTEDGALIDRSNPKAKNYGRESNPIHDTAKMIRSAYRAMVEKMKEKKIRKAKWL
jgi:hypothetical protein